MSETTPFRNVGDQVIHSVSDAEKAIADFKYHLTYPALWNGTTLTVDTRCFACKKVWETCIRDGISQEEMKKYLR
jgi:hypothetical protein